jgi:hypothetical protein
MRPGDGHNQFLVSIPVYFQIVALVILIRSCIQNGKPIFMVYFGMPLLVGWLPPYAFVPLHPAQSWSLNNLGPTWVGDSTVS